MLQLRPTCEHCNKALPAESTDAMICSYECTFCSECVELLENVCPNCGGGFNSRPIRPLHAWRSGISVTDQPASKKITYKPVNIPEHKVFAMQIKSLDPSKR